MARFFIDRPIVAIVISILTVLLGVVAMLGLPIAQYPDIVPPLIQIQTTFPGADAITVEQAVATPLEQQMNGVEDELYMQSVNASDGSITLRVTFDVGTDRNADQVNAQNRVSQAQPSLPADVNTFGLTYRKTQGTPLMLISLYSPKGTYDGLFLGNYALINVNDALYRVPGVGQVLNFGASEYAMRIWVKPDQLAKLSLTVSDLLRAVQSQNTVNPSGQIGAEPAPEGQEFTYSVRAQGRLVTPEEFGNIVVRLNPDGSAVRLRDVSRIELGALSYKQIGRFNGKPSSIIGIYQAPGSNALAVAEGVKKQMADPQGPLPRGSRLRGLRRHHPAGDRGDQGDPDHPRRGDGARHPRRLPLPPELAGDAHPPDRGPGVAHRHLRGFPAPRLLDQLALPLRPRPRDRPRGRRRHRRRRGGRAPYRGGEDAARGDPPGDAGGVGAGRRHRPHPLLGVPPCRLPGRHPGAAQQAVRDHHRHLGPDLGLQRPVALAGPLRSAAHGRGRSRGASSPASSASSTAASRRRPGATSGPPGSSSARWRSPF